MVGGDLYSPKPRVPESKVDFEAGRLDTFDDSWPHPDKSQCSKRNMACAGFFYLGHKDLVRCFCCGIKLESWDPGVDEPWHKHFDSCLFGSTKKREGDLTIGELMDIFANKAIHVVDSKFKKFLNHQ